MCILLLSVFWRAAAHTWRNMSGPMEGIDLGPFEEPIRRFLLGGPFPSNPVVLVSVWPTRDVLPAAYTPRRGRAPGWHVFNFLIPGLEFRLLTGRQIPRELRGMCSFASAEKFIFSAMSMAAKWGLRKLRRTAGITSVIWRLLSLRSTIGKLDFSPSGAWPQRCPLCERSIRSCC